jgi:hypothetical protein
MRDFSKTRFRKRIALTEEHYFYINNKKGKKSAAGFLEQIIQEYVKRQEQTGSTEEPADSPNSSGKIFCDPFNGIRNFERRTRHTERAPESF